MAAVIVRGSEWIARLRTRALRELVERFHVPPALLGYGYLRAESPKDYLQRLYSLSVVEEFIRKVEPAGILVSPLPLNATSRDLLSKERVKRRFSMYDVPERLTQETYVATLPDCRIVTCQDEWQNHFYALLTRDYRVLQVRGTSLGAEHSALLRSSRSVQRIDKASWILEHWAVNYFHWLIYITPKALLLKQLGLEDQLLLPPHNQLESVVRASLQLIGINASRLPQMESSVIEVGQLTVVSIDEFPASLLRELREVMVGVCESAPKRKVFISRAHAQRRHLENEEDIWAILRDSGYERVVMENLTFREQVSLMKDCAVLIGLQGAGLGNMLFCPPGSDIVEIYDPDLPASEFYALASSLKHNYWLIAALPTGGNRPGYQNVRVNPGEFAEVVAQIEQARSIRNFPAREFPC